MSLFDANGNRRLTAADHGRFRAATEAMEGALESLLDSVVTIITTENPPDRYALLRRLTADLAQSVSHVQMVGTLAIAIEKLAAQRVRIVELETRVTELHEQVDAAEESL